jgi:hypothetical protein
MVPTCYGSHLLLLPVHSGNRQLVVLYAFMVLPVFDICTMDVIKKHVAGVTKQEVYCFACGCAQALLTYSQAHVAHL